MATLGFANVLSMQAMLAQTAWHMGADLVHALEAERQGHNEMAQAYINRATRRLGGVQHAIETFPSVATAMRREGDDETVLLDQDIRVPR